MKIIKKCGILVTKGSIEAERCGERILRYI